MKRSLSISLFLLASLGAAALGAVTLFAQRSDLSLQDRLRYDGPRAGAHGTGRAIAARAVSWSGEGVVSMIEKAASREKARSASGGEKGAQTGQPPRKQGSAAKSKPPVDKKGSQTKRPAPLSFRWPTTGRRIVEAYGERSNPETGTVTINPGINIGATLGSAVTAAEDGTVSLVSWLPSYGTIVIVEHRGGYRTVYGNLAATAITRGTIVGAGDRIGTVGATLGGSFLHFEVWKGQTRLNPMSVLRGS